MPRARLLVLGILPMLALAPGSPQASAARRSRDARPPEWREVIEEHDRDRLRQWRQAWVDGLAAARAAGAGTAIAGEGALLKPDAAQADPELPPGNYLCRTIKLGGQPGTTNPALVRTPPVPCSFAADRLAVLAGGQRPAGWLWPYDGVRLLFLGAMGLGDERNLIPYGRDRQRNLAGFVERIGDHHWRLVLPHPEWEALIEVVDLVPAPPTAGGE